MVRPWVKQGQTLAVRKVITKPKGGGKGAGQWVFVPNGANYSQVLAQHKRGQMRPLPKKKPMSKYEEKLRAIEPALKVWIGGLATNTTWKDLEKHFATVAKPSITEVKRNGTAVLAYQSVEEVQTVIAELNGSELHGNNLEVDVWVQLAKAKKEEKPKPLSAKTGGLLKKVLPVKKPVAKVTARPKAKVSAKAKAQNDKMKEKLSAFGPELKVWIGGLSEGTTWKQLDTHMATVAKPKLSHVYTQTGVCVYETEEDVANAIAFLNGTELNGSTLQVDVWTMPERKEKKEKKVHVKQEET